MEFQYYLMAIIGGLVGGSAAGWVLLADGRAEGVHSLSSSSPRPRSADAAWQGIFLLGLVAGGAFLTWLDPAGLPAVTAAPIELVVGAGMLVGFGLRLAALDYLRRQILALITN
ncbi:MAG: hypothetical protein ACE145_18940 [Terriglobia bacterium]